MNRGEKPIKVSQHAKEQAHYRGCSEEEICETIRSSQWQKAELDRLQCQKDFTFNKKWNNEQYRTKQVKPIFVEKDEEIGLDVHLALAGDVSTEELQAKADEDLEWS